MEDRVRLPGFRSDIPDLISPRRISWPSRHATRAARSPSSSAWRWALRSWRPGSEACLSLLDDGSTRCSWRRRPGALARCAQAILETGARTRLGARARERQQAEFDIDAMLDRISGLYAGSGIAPPRAPAIRCPRSPRGPAQAPRRTLTRAIRAACRRHAPRRGRRTRAAPSAARSRRGSDWRSRRSAATAPAARELQPQHPCAFATSCGSVAPDRRPEPPCAHPYTDAPRRQGATAARPDRDDAVAVGLPELTRRRRRSAPAGHSDALSNREHAIAPGADGAGPAERHHPVLSGSVAGDEEGPRRLRFPGPPGSVGVPGPLAAVAA